MSLMGLFLYIRKANGIRSQLYTLDVIYLMFFSY